MLNKTKKVDFVFIILEKYNDTEIEKLKFFINKLFKFENIGKIYIYTTNINDFQIDDVTINIFDRHDTGDSLLSILRNRYISNDFILCTTNNYNFNDDVLVYMLNNPNTIPLIHKENPQPNIKLDEFNRIETVDFERFQGFGYETLGILRMNKTATFTLVQAYHLEFFNKSTNMYVTSNLPGFDILDLFNHTNWGLFTFDIFNIGENHD